MHILLKLIETGCFDELCNNLSESLNENKQSVSEMDDKSTKQRSRLYRLCFRKKAKYKESESNAPESNMNHPTRDVSFLKKLFRSSKSKKVTEESTADLAYTNATNQETSSEKKITEKNPELIDQIVLNSE